MPQRVTPAYIAQHARAHNLDPKAVLAVDAQEGLSGGIGDNGTSFGPSQLHYGGAYPSSAPHGSPQASQAWAWSPSGIEYALAQAEKVAGGQHGARAINSLVRKFERPADPGSEIQGALAAYGHGPHGGGGGAPMAPGAAPESGSAYPARAAPDNHHQVALALLQQVGQASPDYSKVFGLLEQRNATPAAAPPMPSPHMPAAPTQAPHGNVSLTGQLAGLNPRFEQELEQAVGAAGGTKVRVDSGYRSPQHNAAVGGVPHSNHTTGHAADGAAYVPGQGWVPLGTLLRSSAPRFGLRSGDQPGFYNGGRDPVHVDDASNQRRNR